MWWETALRTDVFAFDPWQGWEKGERGRINLSKTILICSFHSFSKYLNICFRKLNMWIMAGLLLFSLQKARALFGVCTSPAVTGKKGITRENLCWILYHIWPIPRETFQWVQFWLSKITGGKLWSYSWCYFFFILHFTLSPSQNIWTLFSRVLSKITSVLNLISFTPKKPAFQVVQNRMECPTWIAACF